MTIDVQATADNFNLEEIVSTEPMEWTDTYKPWKYGIIFKEKIVFHQADSIIASMNLRLLKGGKDMPPEAKRAFRFEILDNNKVIYSRNGWNMVNISHLSFSKGNLYRRFLLLMVVVRARKNACWI